MATQPNHEPASQSVPNLSEINLATAMDFLLEDSADLVTEVLKVSPAELRDRISLLGIPADQVHILDPHLFAEPEQHVQRILAILRTRSPLWFGFLEDRLRNGLLILYEHNRHPDTKPAEWLDPKDLRQLLDKPGVSSPPAAATAGPTDFQLHVQARIACPNLRRWFNAFLSWTPGRIRHLPPKE